jgi:hypothetical protein
MTAERGTLVDLIEAHVLEADRLHADHTPIRVLGKPSCKAVLPQGFFS